MNVNVTPLEIDYIDGGWDEWSVRNTGQVETPSGLITAEAATALRDWLTQVLTHDKARIQELAEELAECKTERDQWRESDRQVAISHSRETKEESVSVSPHGDA